MARARNIKPGFFKNEVLGVADPLYSLLFEGLWLLADRAGRLEDRPLRIKAEIFPYRDNISINDMLNWLQANGFIRRYVADGKACILVLEFVKHQNPHKNEPESTLPEPQEAPTCPNIESVTGDTGTTSEKIGTGSDGVGLTPEKIGSTRADSGFRIPDSGFSDSLNPKSGAPDSEPPAGAVTQSFEEFWKAWPPNERKHDKAKCLKHWKSEKLAKHLPAILADIALKRKTQKWADGFIEAPLVYLRGQRWNDGVQPDEPMATGALDPDSRAAVEAEGVANGVGKWKEGMEQWGVYKARVRAASKVEA